MKLRDNPPVHLTYCLSAHGGESWTENFAAIRDKATVVRDKVRRCTGRSGPFGLGLRLGNQAANQLAKPAEMDKLRRFLADNGMYVFTINGFPYGPFHAQSVKDKVYEPDWRRPERLEYTIRLADILAKLLPEGVTGSISTAPLSYKPWGASPADVQRMLRKLLDAAAHCRRIRLSTGKDICLALEPEPDCLLGCTDEVIEFFQGPLTADGLEHLRSRHDLSDAEAQDTISRHLGVCFDTSHAAVEFENIPESLTRLQKANIRIAKVQLAAAVQLTPASGPLRRLREFQDDVYLHQLRIQTAGGEVLRYADLPDAPSDARGQTWRVHYHVPLDWAGDGELGTTRAALTGGTAEMLAGGVSEHLEIETYTYEVLPTELRGGDIAGQIAEEYRWVLEHLLASASG